MNGLKKRKEELKKMLSKYAKHYSVAWLRSEAELKGIELAEKEFVKYLDEEIEYLENHVKTANKGIKINVERVESWIFEAKKVRQELKQVVNDEKCSCPDCKDYEDCPELKWREDDDCYVPKHKQR